MSILCRASLLTLLLTLASITTASPITNLPNTHALTPRHSYALICALSSTMTRQCSSAPLFYFCTASGALAQNFPAGGPYVVNDTCEEHCECFDTNPAPPKWPPSCIINIDGSANCNGKKVIGVISKVTMNDTASIGSASTEFTPTPILPSASSSTTQPE